MYTEGFDGLGETEPDEPRRAYVSNLSQDDSDRLMRENERLKKALEKEKFFNKLLDQEIQELKSGNGRAESQPSEYWYGSRGVSKGMFYSLLFITLAMAGYIGYGIYYDKQFDYLKDLTPAAATPATEGSAQEFSTPVQPEETTPISDEQPKTPQRNANITPDVESPADKTPARSSGAVKDSVPPIIARQQPPVVKENVRKAPAALPAEPKQEVDVESANTGVPAQQAIDTRPVIGRYKVASKANFYSSPDENTLRSTFISQGDDKIVGALEDKNGFIYVVYTNDLGYVTRGWLSKKDLEKVD